MGASNRTTPRLRWEHGHYTMGVSRFFQVRLGMLKVTVQWDLMSRREWEVWTTVEWRQKDYVRCYLGPGVIPF